MTRTTIRPTGVGPMLDRSLHIYRKLFAPLFLGTLIAFGPVFALSNALLINFDALPLVPEFRFDDADRFWESRLPDNLFSGGTDDWVKALGVTLLALVLMFLIIPVYMAWCATVVNRTIDDGEAPSLTDAFREAWSRYGRVLGNGLLYWLISIGVYMAVSFGNVILSLLYGSVILSTAALAASPGAGAAAGVAVLILYIVFVYGGAMAYYYFALRFGYFLPPLLFENESVGIGRSWSLTRRSFWRLLAVYVNFGGLGYVFAAAAAFAFALLGASVAGLLLMLAFVCAFAPAGIVVYIYTYRVQKVRNDGDDLEGMLARLRGPAASEAEGTAL